MQDQNDLSHKLYIRPNENTASCCGGLAATWCCTAEYGGVVLISGHDDRNLVEAKRKTPIHVTEREMVYKKARNVNYTLSRPPETLDCVCHEMCIY